MAELSVLAHRRATIRRISNSKSKELPFAFAAACLERVLPILVRLDHPLSIDSNKRYRLFLDEVWRWIADIKSDPPDHRNECHLFLLEEVSTKRDGRYHHVSTLIYSFSEVVFERLSDECSQYGYENLTLLNTFIHDTFHIPMTPENDSVVDQHELIQAEILKQNLDLRDLELFSPDALKSVQLRSYGQCLLNGFWYEDLDEILVNY